MGLGSSWDLNNSRMQVPPLSWRDKGRKGGYASQGPGMTQRKMELLKVSPGKLELWRRHGCCWRPHQRQRGRGKIPWLLPSSHPPGPSSASHWLNPADSGPGKCSLQGSGPTSPCLVVQSRGNTRNGSSAQSLWTKFQKALKDEEYSLRRGRRTLQAKKQHR